MKSDITAKEERLAKKEETLESRILRLEEKEAKIEVQKEDLVSKETYLNELVDKGNQELERISELSKEEAAKVILTKLENELDHDKAGFEWIDSTNADQSIYSFIRYFFLIEFNFLFH
jgi:ribonuclease Y